MVCRGFGNEELAQKTRPLVLGDGLRFEDGDGNLIEDCYIGTDLTSVVVRGGAGLHVKDSSSNTIRKNVISGNGRFNAGLLITGVTATDHVVTGNFIGTDASGTIQVSNGINAAGVHIVNAPDNTIGGTNEDERNVISGTGSGVVIFGATASNNQVVGNLIGTDITGTVALEAFGGHGVTIHTGPNNLVQGNLISGNNNSGVKIENASGNKVLQNGIGVASDGIHDVPTQMVPRRVQYVGVRLTDASGNVVGELGAGNIISGNEFGVAIEGRSTGNRVQSNKIGVNDEDGPLGNASQGVYVQGNGNVIGGLDPTEGNAIAYSGLNGILVAAGVGNALIENAIFANAELGINLGFDDVTPNDEDDADGGANGSLNFPEFELVNGVLQGTLTTKPGTYRVDFFVVEECDPSGHGEADAPLSGITVTVGATGFASFTPPAPERGRFLTATATELVGGVPKSTSELSACAAPVDVTPTKGDLIVDSLGDEPDAAPGNGKCATAAGKCTLRAAIQEANVLPKRQRVVFNVPGGGPLTIKPGPPGLPVIDRALVIDGSTQPGAATAPLIEIDGSNAGPDTNGLALSDNKNGVRGLVINRFGGHGILLTGHSGKSVVQGNSVGTDVGGTSARGNGGDGIHVSGSPKNLIGGPAVNLGNVVSGNLGHGMLFELQANGNVVVGNSVGTNPARTAAVPNLGSGIVLAGTTSKNVVGSDALVPNVISGNTWRPRRRCRNAMFGNAPLDIDLGGDGPSAADLGDADIGPNTLQNPPELLDARRAGEVLELHGRLRSTPKSKFVVDLFLNDTCP